MKPAISCLLGFLLICSLPSWARLPDRGISLPYREGEILVQYRSTQALELAKSGHSAHGLSLKKTIGSSSLALMQLPALTTVEAVLPLLATDPDITFAEPNYLRQRLAFVPDDTHFSQQWGLYSTGQANFVPDADDYASVIGADMAMPEAWDADGDGIPDRTGTGNVVVAIIDDAFALTHVDLASNFIQGRDLTGNDDNDPSPDNASLQNHGTLVAGSLGAVGNNGIGVAGVIWNVQMMPLKVGQIVDGSVELDTASILQAYSYARQNGAQIINASYGGPSFSQAEYNALAALADADILFVTAAGNFNANLDKAVAAYPANYDLPNVMAIAATNRQDNIASFSQHGPMSTDVAAPGLQIVTTNVGNSYSTPNNCGNGGSCGVSGTSFASPYTAGLAALIRDYLPNASALETRARIIEGAEPGADGGDAGTLSAGGSVNAANSLNLDARPSILLKAVEIDDGGNGRLDPGETVTLTLTLENLWRDASDVVVTLDAPNNALILSNPSIALGTLASNSSAQVSAVAQVQSPSEDYAEFLLTANIDAVDTDSGSNYSTSRHALLEIAALADGVTAQSTLSTGLHDEFHGYHFDLTSLPGDGFHLAFRTTASADIDLLVKAGTPPQYDIDLGADPDDNPTFFTDADAVGGEAGGDERVILCTPEVGTYYLTVLNYSLEENLPYTLTAVVEADAPGECGTPADNGDNGNSGDGSGGGGGLSWPLLALLGIAALGRRRDRRRRMHG